MAKQLQKDEQRIRFRFPPIESQIILALMAAMLCVFALQSDLFGTGPVLLMIALFAGGMWSKRAWIIWLLLGILVGLNYFTAHPFQQYHSRNLQMSDLVTALMLMALAAACFRFLETDRFISTFYPSASFGEKPKPGVKFEFPSLFGGRWWAIPLAIFLALVLLQAIPLDRTEFFRQFRIKPVASRVFFLVLFLFFAWYVCRAVVGTIVRWRMKPDQAEVHCRSLIASEFWKDAWAIERRREKNKKARSD